MVYSPGTYTCKITSCGIVTFASIDVLPSQVSASISYDSLLCEGDSIILTANSGMETYNWFPTGDTTQQITISDTGWYALTTFDSSGCSANSDTVTIGFVDIEANVTLNGPTTFCHGDSILLTANTGLDHYQWLPSNDTGLTLTVHEPGSYAVITTDTNGCIAYSDTIELFTPDTTTTFSINGETEFCENDSVILTAQSSNSSQFIWTPGNVTTSSITVYQSGTYSLATTDVYGCKAYSDSIDILVEENNLIRPSADDTLICAGLPITMYASSPSGNIVWYDTLGNTINYGDSYTPSSTDSALVFMLFSESTYCKSEPNPVYLEVEDCHTVNAPNVFTPNNDGTNDFFSLHINGITCFNCKIYNRWGLLIYEIKNMDGYWDGTVIQSGELAVDGTYYYIAEFCKYDGRFGSHTGYITLIRDDN